MFAHVGPDPLVHGTRELSAMQETKQPPSMSKALTLRQININLLCARTAAMNSNNILKLQSILKKLFCFVLFCFFFFESCFKAHCLIGCRPSLAFRTNFISLWIRQLALRPRQQTSLSSTWGEWIDLATPWDDRRPPWRDCLQKTRSLRRYSLFVWRVCVCVIKGSLQRKWKKNQPKQNKNKTQKHTIQNKTKQKLTAVVACGQ